MWAFTSRDPQLDFRAATMFAAASRALKGYNDELAARALKQSKRLLKEANEIMEKRMKEADASDRRPRRMEGGNVATNLQLYIATGEKPYLDKFESQIWNMLDRNVNFGISTAIDAVPYMDEAYKEKLRPYVEKYREYVLELEKDNPYGVPIGLGNWAGSGNVVNFGTTLCFASKYFPDIISKDHAYKVAGYMFGCHPYHNYSQLSAPPVRSRSSTATTVRTSLSSLAMWHLACSSAILTTLRIMMTGRSSGVRTKAQ